MSIQQSEEFINSHNVLQLTKNALPKKFLPRVRCVTNSNARMEVSLEPPLVIRSSNPIKKRYSTFVAKKLVDADKKNREAFLNMFQDWSVDLFISSAHPEDELALFIRIENISREFFAQQASPNEIRDVLKLSARDLDFAIKHRHLPSSLSLKNLLEITDVEKTQLRCVIKNGIKEKSAQARKDENETLAAHKCHLDSEIRRVAVSAGDIKARVALELALCCSLLGHSLLQAKTTRSLNATRILESGIKSLEAMGYAHCSRTAAFVSIAGYETVFVSRRISSQTNVTVCKLRRHQIGNAVIYACRSEAKKIFPECYLLSRIEEIAKLISSGEGHAFATAA